MQTHADGRAEQAPPLGQKLVLEAIKEVLSFFQTEAPEVPIDIPSAFKLARIYSEMYGVTILAETPSERKVSLLSHFKEHSTDSPFILEFVVDQNTLVVDALIYPATTDQTP